VPFLQERRACIAVEENSSPIRLVFGNNIAARKKAQILLKLQQRPPQPEPAQRTEGHTAPPPWRAAAVRPQGKQWFHRSDNQAYGLLDSQPPCVGGDTLTRPYQRIDGKGRWQTKGIQPDACTRVNLLKLCYWILSEISNDELLREAHTIMVITDSQASSSRKEDNG
jgi:hypothetical protein